MQKRDPKPEIQRLEELALAVRAGDIKLPRFQRPFVWKRGEMLKLLDSIYKGYPIGSLLIWNSSQRLTSERSLSGLELNISDYSNYPTNYLLDGQQRLTTLCGALFWQGKEPNSQWSIYFDLEREEFVHPRESSLIHLFPLNKLIDTSDFIRQCMKFEHHENGPRLVRNAERLLRSLKDYKVAVVKIGDMTIEEVAPIFERINSTGRKLTIVDLMMAATWSDTFDLNSVISDIKSAAREHGFSDLKDQVLLRSISAAAGNGINKDDIQKLRKISPSGLTTAAAAAKAGVLAAIRFLGDRLNIFDFTRIPYALQFTHLTEYFRLRGAEAEQEHRLDELERWFWYTAVTRYFSSSNSGQNSKDLLLIRQFAKGAINELFERSEIDISDLLFSTFNLRNSISTTFILLLSQERPSATADGKSMDEMYLTVKDSKFYSSLTPQGADSHKQNISKVIHPYTEMPNIQRLVGDLSEHLLDEAATAHLFRGDYSSFCIARASVISERVRELTSCDTSYHTGLPVDNQSEEDLDPFSD